jgi:hypothetical protein
MFFKMIPGGGREQILPDSDDMDEAVGKYTKMIGQRFDPAECMSMAWKETLCFVVPLN